MGNDFVREECTQGRVDGCREGADESHEVIERCCGFVLSCFVLKLCSRQNSTLSNTFLEGP